MFLPSDKAITKGEDILLNIIVPFILLTPFLPMELFMLMDIIWLWTKFKYEKEYKKRFPKEFLHITDPDVFSDLAHVEYALLDKTGTLTETAPIISSVFFNGKIYKLENISKPKEEEKKDKRSFIYLEKNLKESAPLLTSANNKLNVADCTDVDAEINSGNSPSLLEKNLQNLTAFSSYCKFIEGVNGNEEKIEKKNASKQFEISIDKQMNLNKEGGKNFVDFDIEAKPKQSIVLEMNEGKPVPSTPKIALYNPANNGLDEEFYKIPNLFGEEDFLHDGKMNMQKFIGLFEIMALCHYSFANFDQKLQKYQYYSKYREMETLLRFCEEFGVRYEGANRKENPDEYTLAIGGEGKKIKYKVMGIFDYSATEKSFPSFFKAHKQKNIF